METKNTFDEWFHQLEAFSLKSERFFGECDHYLENLTEDDKKEGEKILLSWLKAAFYAGVECGQKEKKS
jgi:hypothetical protein